MEFGAIDRYRRAFSEQPAGSAVANDRHMCTQLTRALDTLLPEMAPFDVNFGYRWTNSSPNRMGPAMRNILR